MIPQRRREVRVGHDPIHRNGELEGVRGLDRDTARRRRERQTTGQSRSGGIGALGTELDPTTRNQTTQQNVQILRQHSVRWPGQGAGKPQTDPSLHAE